jgi:ubiquinone/menaquinone biosynthesis C-methylase UbiE
MNEKIKQYWDERAKDASTSPVATTNDIYLRELEVNTLINTIRDCPNSKSGVILDVGCGDGYSTIAVANELSGNRFYGVDYSSKMIENARQRLAQEAPSTQSRIEFIEGSVELLDACGGGRQYDIIITDRCLINLDSFASQAHAIQAFACMLKPGGYYIAIENFMGGQRNLNDARIRMGLQEIPMRWHNLYFEEEDFLAVAREAYAEVTMRSFSSAYYYATRVIYSTLCRIRNKQPDYLHDIHKLAISLPPIGDYSPIKLVICRVSQGPVAKP